MEFKGTKGEWKITGDNIIEDGSGYISIGTDKDWWLLEAKGTHVGAETVEQARANAKLILCAPEMLEVLQKFIDLFIESDMRPEDECHELYEEINNVIKKATTI